MAGFMKVIGEDAKASWTTHGQSRTPGTVPESKKGFFSFNLDFACSASIHFLHCLHLFLFYTNLFSFGVGLL
jgi:hypothetical protein